MASELARAGVEHELVHVPRGAHGFDWDQNDPAARSAMERTLAFLERHLASPARD
jgi:hypothetical protein